MNTRSSLEFFRHGPATVGLIAIACLLSITAQAQRPSIAALQTQITAQQTQIAALQANNVPNLASYVAMDVSNPARPTLRVTAANLQVVNGLGFTSYINGLGNVIVGYDEIGGPPFLPFVCSLGQYVDETNCVDGGGTWWYTHKSGSHNIVVGPYHRYSRSGGLIAGSSNTVNGDNASISGGTVNTASGFHAAVSGGRQHTASGDFSSVSGGYANRASNQYASVSGGHDNTASGNYGSVSGGLLNTASGNESSVTGGVNNAASGPWSSVTGGGENTASANRASVSGGGFVTASGVYDWAAGTLHSP